MMPETHRWITHVWTNKHREPVMIRYEFACVVEVHDPWSCFEDENDFFMQFADQLGDTNYTNTFLSLPIQLRVPVEEKVVDINTYVRIIFTKQQQHAEAMRDMLQYEGEHPHIKIRAVALQRGASIKNNLLVVNQL